MDEIVRTKAQERIRQLLPLVDIPQEKKDEIANSLNTLDVEALEHLSEKLELIHSWEIKEDIDERIVALEENFDVWMENIKKGVVEAKTSEQLKVEGEKIKTVLEEIKKSQ